MCVLMLQVNFGFPKLNRPVFFEFGQVFQNNLEFLEQFLQPVIFQLPCQQYQNTEGKIHISVFLYLVILHLHFHCFIQLLVNGKMC